MKMSHFEAIKRNLGEISIPVTRFLDLRKIDSRVNFHRGNISISPLTTVIFSGVILDSLK